MAMADRLFGIEKDKEHLTPKRQTWMWMQRDREKMSVPVQRAQRTNLVSTLIFENVNRCRLKVSTVFPRMLPENSHAHHPHGRMTETGDVGDDSLNFESHIQY
jgi:hypothetical protein